MKLAKVERGGRLACGLITGDVVHILGGWTDSTSRDTSFTLPNRSQAELEKLADDSVEAVALDDVLILPPIGPSSKLICLGLNYRAHLAEANEGITENPGLFTKLADALVGHGMPVIRPTVSENFDYEGEIAVVIGQHGRHIAKTDSLAHVFGYTIMLDGSVRDYQQHSVSAGKNFFRSGALGPWIVTADEIPNPAILSLETRLNGEVVQATTADLMIFDIPTAIEYISRWTPLAPGDVIATGTPAGVGAMRQPPLWMKHGDSVEITVSHIGTQCNPVRDESGTAIAHDGANLDVGVQDW
jgi:2-keto-4-pentenoate hydratase/2-oxohepta-3-ene-1,7-dioic acid hydratase in catechol pathway